jgi:transposase
MEAYQQKLSTDQVSGQVLDHLGLIAATINSLGLIEKIDQKLPLSEKKGAKVSMGARVGAMILNGLGFIDDRLYLFPEFLSNKPVERLLGEDYQSEDFNDDALGRCLDAIYDYGVSKLFSELAFSIGIEKKLLGSSAHFDTTTLLVYGEYSQEDMIENQQEGQEAIDNSKTPISITHGYSKAHRGDLKQMVLTLATRGAASFPIWMEAHSGNGSDKKILPTAAKRMESFSKALKDIPDFLYVGDSALYENCLKEGGTMKWISRVPESISQAKKWLSTPEEELSWQELENGYRISSLSSNYGQVDQRWLLVYSKQAYQRESKTLEKQVKKELEATKKALKELSKQQFQCEKDAFKAAKGLEKKLKYHLLSLTSQPIEQYSKPGRPTKGKSKTVIGYQLIGQLRRDEEGIKLKARQKGRFILATNQLDCSLLPSESILLEYKGQSKTESSFAFIKNNAFEVCSVFLKKPSRIEALMMIMTLCLMVYSVAQYQLRKALKEKDETIPSQTKKPTQIPRMLWVCRLFQGVHLLHITLPGQSQELVINLKELTRRIVGYFGPYAEKIYGLST